MSNAATAVTLMSTEAVLRKHLRGATIGVDAVMADYTDQSVMITPDATYRGLAEIRRFFTDLFRALPAGFFGATMKMSREEIVGEVAYILWEGKPIISQATDTFVVRNGKILFQTFTATR
jgi:ketosteroid isomerase-like protein